MTVGGSVFNLTCWVDVLRRTFLMSVSLLTLMSMLTGVLGNASKTSRSRGMRVSSPPSQKHSAQKSTRCKRLRSGLNAASERRALTRKLQHDSLARRICVRVPLWKVTPSLQRYEGSCCKEHKTKGHLHWVRLEPSEDVASRLMWAVKLIKWLWLHVFWSSSKRKKTQPFLFACIACTTNLTEQHVISPLWFRGMWLQVTWSLMKSTWSISPGMVTT